MADKRLRFQGSVKCGVTRYDQGIILCPDKASDHAKGSLHCVILTLLGLARIKRLAVLWFLGEGLNCLDIS
jgi:hypothetical protein